MFLQIDMMKNDSYNIPKEKDEERHLEHEKVKKNESSTIILNHKFIEF